MLDFFSFSVLSVVFVFGTVVVVHEFGHFFVAKLFKIRVDAFAVGFGPRLFGFRKGETEYKLCAIPLGGYVKMAGETPGEDLTGSVEEFLSRPKWQRFLVAVMGPVMNVVLAVFLLTALFYFRYEVEAYQTEPVVVGVIETESPAERAGIWPGDRVVAVADKDHPNWEQFSLEVATSANRELPLKIQRQGQTLLKMVPVESQGRNHLGYLGVYPFSPELMTVKKVLPGKPAELAGMKAGDRILKIGDVDLRRDGKDLADVLKHSTGELLPFVVLRDGQEVELQVKPYVDAASNRRMIGIERDFPKMVVKELSLTQAFQTSVQQNIKFAGLIFDILQRLFRREVSMRMLSGPIGIAQESGRAARSGFSTLLMLMAAISLNLAVINLLPIPILDGGVIAIILVEALIRRDLSLTVRERITQVGFVLLILLAVIVTYNDIVKILPASLEKYLP
ncbi:MAG: RIP metalloprotease RseP [Acidobacteriota bacterium]